LLVMPLSGSLREDRVVYWNSRSTTASTSIAPVGVRVTVGEVPPT
jgi:hypothetical protein